MTYRTHLLTLAFTLVAAVALAGQCGGAYKHEHKAQSVSAESQSVVDVAVSSGNFKTLVAAVQAADLVETLAGDGPFTVFAPTDEAFAALPEGTLAHLLKPENKGELQRILTHHVVPGKVAAADVVELSSARSVAGLTLPVEVTEGTVRVGGAKVIQTDIMAANGVIHVIDAVMLPQNLLEVAANTKAFSTLVAAVKAGELTAVLGGEGPFTVFAPTNDAFAALPEGTLDSLLKPENKATLQAILKYHVVPGRVLAEDVIKLEAAQTAQGSSVSIRVADDKVMIDDATVVKTDIETLNGVIHVIDKVILPSS